MRSAIAKSHAWNYEMAKRSPAMIIRRRVLGIPVEIHWFDASSWLASKAPLALLRSASPPPKCSCLWKEATQSLDLSQSEDEWLARRPAKFRYLVRQGFRDYAFLWAEDAGARGDFYAAYVPFAKARGLGIPDPAEEGELDLLLARDADGKVAYAAAFLPVSGEKRYRYRYGMHGGASQAGRAALVAGMRLAREKGFAIFDLGGVNPRAKPGTAAAGIQAFKNHFGGKSECIWAGLRSPYAPLRAALVFWGLLMRLRARIGGSGL